MFFLKQLLIAVLTLESRLIVAKYKPYIVAVTGSVGKTSTKDAIYDALKKHVPYARKSEKSMNSEIGLPLTVIGAPTAWRSFSGWMSNLRKGAGLILRRQEYPDTLILEIGADHPGDISSVARWLRADIVVVTQVSATPVHVEFFASPEQVFEEKASLAGALKKGGTLVLSADNDKVMSIASRVADKDARVVSFGTSEGATVRGSGERVIYEGEGTSRIPSGCGFTVTVEGSAHEIVLSGIVGMPYMFPILAAVAVARAKGIAPDVAIGDLASYAAPRGRMNLIPGVNGSTLIDDTYNSSPDAALAALRTLRDIEMPGSRIAVLGDMLELGKYASDEHRRIGTEVVALGIGKLVTVGPRSRLTAQAAREAGMDAAMVTSFDTSIEAGEHLKSSVKEGDVVLIKGSQSIRMEKTVAILMRDPSRAGELLVRQEPEWLKK